MQFRSLCVMVLATGLATAACQPTNSPIVPTTGAPATTANSAPGPPAASDLNTDLVNGVPAGWKVYTPPEGDFSVVAPGDLIESSSNVTKVYKVRNYVFKKGDAAMVCDVYSERTGAIATNSVDELRGFEDIIPGTLRDVALPGMTGIEFRTSSAQIGEVIFREFCSPDNSRSISMYVQKDVGTGCSEADVRTFLDSFKLLP